MRHLAREPAAPVLLLEHLADERPRVGRARDDPDLEYAAEVLVLVHGYVLSTRMRGGTTRSRGTARGRRARTRPRAPAAETERRGDRWRRGLPSAPATCPRTRGSPWRRPRAGSACGRCPAGPAPGTARDRDWRRRCRWSPA